MKEMILRQRGKVLSYADYVRKNRMNETIAFELNKDIIDIQLDSTCINTVLKVLDSECGGKVENLKKYLADGTDIKIGRNEIIRHVMELVKEYLNNGVNIEKGLEHITSLDDFIHKGENLDFVSAVDAIICKLYNEDDNTPKYADLIIDLLDTDTDIDGDVKDEEEE